MLSIEKLSFFRLAKFLQKFLTGLEIKNYSASSSQDAILILLIFQYFQTNG
jgi:hypothetical protein